MFVSVISIFTGPAPSNVTDAIFALTQKITEYHICPDLAIDLKVIGTQQFTVDGNPFTVEVIDCVTDYAAYMREIFDFPKIKTFLAGEGGKPFNVTANAMHGGRNLVNISLILTRLVSSTMS